MDQLPPEFGQEYADRAAAAAAAALEPGDLVDGLPIVPVSTGIPHLMVPVRDESVLRRAVRDDRACEQVCADADDSESLYLFAVRGDGDVMARMFDRSTSIGEDPATGSAAGPLGAYLSAHGLAGMPGACVVAQGEMTGRPSFLHVEAEPADSSWAIQVGGGVRIVGDGAFVL
jgi:PhzF family phenazine biosynthesis protein